MVAPGGGRWNVQNYGGDSGLHNKPAGCGASEAYPSDPGSEEEEEEKEAKEKRRRSKEEEEEENKKKKKKRRRKRRRKEEEKEEGKKKKRRGSSYPTRPCPVFSFDYTHLKIVKYTWK
jgi:hypothetical protein